MAPKRINLALQGGGAHGAFTWGVLDRILEDEGIEIAAISGTSAGALNAAALKSGMIEGGREGARANLDWLWGQVGAINDMRMTSWITALTPAPSVYARAVELSWPYVASDVAARLFSPYSYGLFYRNPLERIVNQMNFGNVCASEGPDLHICATNVRTGKIRVFAGQEIGTEAILASACLPTLFKAIEIEDPETGIMEAYWDGGYTGNPALFPLFMPDYPNDILVVNINPLHREALPTSAAEIQNRINEISFNSSLLRELRAINFVKRLLGQGALSPGSMKDVYMHMIADDALMNGLSVASKLVPAAGVLLQLKEAGRAAAGAFLANHRSDLNVRGTLDLEEMFA